MSLLFYWCGIRRYQSKEKLEAIEETIQFLNDEKDRKLKNKVKKRLSEKMKDLFKNIGQAKKED